MGSTFPITVAKRPINATSCSGKGHTVEEAFGVYEKHTFSGGRIGFQARLKVRARDERKYFSTLVFTGVFSTERNILGLSEVESLRAYIRFVVRIPEKIERFPNNFRNSFLKNANACILYCRRKKL